MSCPLLSGGQGADIAPLDLALGWGPMSDPAVVARISIRQADRRYYWRVANFAAVGLEQRDIERNSANVHIIPASDELRDALAPVAAGDVVSLRGYLVAVHQNGREVVKSSTTRGDVGDGACEVLLVDSVRIESAKAP